jgi:hypothetical protein
MANANSNILKKEVSIKARKDLNGDLILQIAILLNRAHGVLDLLFTMECEGYLENLVTQSLGGALDSAMSQIDEARHLITKVQS